jgi:phenylpyruvate tautomerase PptA (4-oxalocrotonate tautomerase family)
MRPNEMLKRELIKDLTELLMMELQEKLKENIQKSTPIISKQHK